MLKFVPCLVVHCWTKQNWVKCLATRRNIPSYTKIQENQWIESRDSILDHVHHLGFLNFDNLTDFPVKIYPLIPNFTKIDGSGSELAFEATATIMDFEILKI